MRRIGPIFADSADLSSLGPASGFFPVSRIEPTVEVSFRYSDIDRAMGLARGQLVHSRPLHGLELDSFLTATREWFVRNRETCFAASGAESGRTLPDLEMEFNQCHRYLSGIGRAQSPEFRPRGIAAVASSQTWPWFQALEFSISNLMVGNPVIYKPSERTVFALHHFFLGLGEEIPEWKRVQFLPGDREFSRRLLCHEAVSLVLFQGAFETGMRVKQDTLSQPGKDVLLFLGAKNPVILDEAVPDPVLDRVIRDAFLGAGQNCRSASLLFVREKDFEGTLDRVHNRAKAFSIGTLEEGAWMGPLQDSAQADRYLKFIGISEREGAEIRMRGKPLSGKAGGAHVTPTLAVFRELGVEALKKSVSLQTEIYGPHLSVIRYPDRETLLALLGRVTYGRSCSFYGSVTDSTREWFSSLPYGYGAYQAGLFDLDPLASGRVKKRSGNHAMSGLALPALLSDCMSIG